MEPEEKLYTVEDIANMSSLTTRTIRNHLKDGLLKGKKVGGQWRFTKKDVQDWYDNSNTGNEIKSNKIQQVYDFIEGVNTDLTDEIQICNIIDVYYDNEEETKKLFAVLREYMNTNTNFTQSVTKTDINIDYNEDELKIRIIVLGNIIVVSDVIEIVKYRKNMTA